MSWIKCSERLPDAGVEVLIRLTDGRLASAHLDSNRNGDIITRPLTVPGEVVRQWPAWDIGDEENYHEATHWQPLPEAPKDGE